MRIVRSAGQCARRDVPGGAGREAAATDEPAFPS